MLVPVPRFSSFLSQSWSVALFSARRRGVPAGESLGPKFYCAQFCATPQSQTIVSGHTQAGKPIACMGAVIQHDRRQSHSVSILFGRSLNQRVGGSSPPRFTKFPSVYAASRRPLRANIPETVLVLLINEQGEKEKGRDERYFSWCCFF
jgi:hypothetical protein